MKKRLMRCECNYELRMGASTCPYCFRATPLRNRYWFWALAVVLVAILLGLVLYDGAHLLTGAPGSS